MNHQVRLSDLLNIGMLVLLSSCQAVATPLTTALPMATTTPQPTMLPLPTATQQPTVTPLPTATPAPLCGTVVLPDTAKQVTDEIKTSAKFEPPDNQVYFGFTYQLWDEYTPSENVRGSDTRPFAERICDSVQFELGGKTPTLMMVYSGWGSAFSNILGDINKINTVLGPSVTPIVAWQTYANNNTQDIASGKFDGFITLYAKEVKKHGKPLFIRLFCSGFNGNWDESCNTATIEQPGSPREPTGLTSEDFVNAWHRVVDIFRQEGVTNVAWIWEPAVPVPHSLGQDWEWDDDWQAYYPGDDYVDWVGALQGGWGESNWLNPLNQFSIDHHKPLLVEFGIRHALSNMTSQQWFNWLAAMLDYFKSHPQIKAISYTNQTGGPDLNPTSPTDLVFLYDGKVSYSPDANDFDTRLLTGGDEMRALFANHIMDPRYISVLVVKP